MASALPAENLVARTTGQDIQNQCSQNQTAKCCDSLQKSLFNLIPIQLGINCVSLNCESAIHPETGLVNIGNVCVPVNAA
ncbi:MAG: hypothetical protein L6R38_007650 [Xanthoria sp. 2 TBL-2021]|nr:MAG: hypothetical protein L6R38_007650 [Xanthoria sp. 2 TBL-2021]